MRRKLVAALAIAALAVAGCAGPQPSSGGSGSSSSLNVYLYQEPAGLFGPLAPSSGPDNQVMSFLYEGLLGVDPDYELQPRLAESYEVSSDATTFTFKLRKGLKWSDGKPFTSKDVLYTYKLLADPKSGSATAGLYTAVAGVADFVAGKTTDISGFEAPDDNTFVIRATSPNYGLVSQIGIAYILPEHVLGTQPATDIA